LVAPIQSIHPEADEEYAPDLISSARLSAQEVMEPEKVDSSIVSIIPVSQVYQKYSRKVPAERQRFNVQHAIQWIFRYR